MKKKKLLFIALALVLVMIVLMPSAAFAKNNQYQHKAAYIDFTGSGSIIVSDFENYEIEGNEYRYYGEIVEGPLYQSDWDLLDGDGAGAYFWSTHNSVVWVAEDGIVRGMMQGDFTITSSRGTLFGTFQGKITGHVVLGDIFPTDISDTGTWRCTGGTEDFEGIEAWGKWSAVLNMDPGFGTLVGSLDWSGKYSNPEKWDGEKPGKPEKPWKSDDVKPGKPFKGWKNYD